MNRVLASVLAIFAIVAIGVVVPASAAAQSDSAVTVEKGKGKGKKKNKKTLTVCKHGCKYKTITKALKKVKKKNSTIKVKPGKYSEGVIVEGHKYDGLTIKGTKKDPSKVVLDGTNAKGPDGIAQNGIEGIDVKKLTIENMTAKNFATNGFFVRDSEPAPATKIDCADYVMKNLVAVDNRSYGLYAFGCAGGKMINSEGSGHGDSLIYVGGTPIQENPKRTIVSGISAYENVLGYSGTNSRYVTIKDSAWFNNGIGLVPNTLDSEPFEPTSDGIIENNDIFWNNYNYYLPNSPTETVSDGLGEVFGTTLNYPTGIGIALFGADGWIVRNNDIFGNFKWGTALFSDPFNCEGPSGDDCPTGDDAMSQNNQVINNLNGRGGTDTNGVDFWSDGSGKGNCFQGNVSSTFDSSSEEPNSFLYPSCPAPASSGTGTPAGLPDQLVELIAYSGANPPESMECSWSRHPHPAFEDYEPVEITPGPECPE